LNQRGQAECGNTTEDEDEDNVNVKTRKIICQLQLPSNAKWMKWRYATWKEERMWVAFSDLEANLELTCEVAKGMTE
jgi:hypothetical protein